MLEGKRRGKKGKKKKVESPERGMKTGERSFKSILNRYRQSGLEEKSKKEEKKKESKK